LMQDNIMTTSGMVHDGAKGTSRAGGMQEMVHRLLYARYMLYTWRQRILVLMASKQCPPSVFLEFLLAYRGDNAL
jgi:hypothetical protein